MKKTLSIIILGILIFSSIGVTALHENSIKDIIKIKEKILISKPILIDENNFLVSYPEVVDMLTHQKEKSHYSATALEATP